MQDEETRHTYLGVKVIQSLDSELNASSMNRLLDLLADLDRLVHLMGLQVGFLAELGSSVGITFHSQVIKYQGVDIAGGPR